MSTENHRRRTPQPRSGHVAVSFGEFMIVWGGYCDTDIPLFTERYMPPSEVWVYHADMDRWHHQKTVGDVPPGTSGASAVMLDHHMYLLFGHTAEGNSNAVYRLNVFTWVWEHCSQRQQDKASPSPRDKLAIWHYNNRIYAFGGFGNPFHDYQHDSGEFVVDFSTRGPIRGWNNQLHILDPDKMTWTNPVCKGCPPSARAAHAVACVGDKAYIFGGRHNDQRLNDLHCLHLPTLTWSGSLLGDADIHMPASRSWHSLTPVSSTHLVLFGGYSQQRQPLGDCWLLDLSRLRWLPVQLSHDRARLWHTACITSDGDVLIFGGCSNDILSEVENTHHSNVLLIFRSSPKTLLRLCLDRVFSLRDTLETEWESLPQTLAKRLKMKLPEYDSSDMFKDEQEVSHHSATTCVIS